MFQGTGMEKENSASGGGGGGGGGGGAEAAVTPGATSTSEKLQADQANPLLDPTALFGGKSFSLVLLAPPPFSPFISPPARVTSPFPSSSHRLTESARFARGLCDKRRRYAKRRRWNGVRRGGCGEREEGGEWKEAPMIGARPALWRFNARFPRYRSAE